MERRAERRLVTCLFVDIVGSTDTMVRLGPERVRRLLDGAFEALTSIVEAEGGLVEKYVGDAIFALFGVPAGHADDPVRALRAAEACLDWSSTPGRSEEQLALRIGIETGEAMVELTALEERQRMAVGTCVNVAARLQQQAEPGEILVGPSCHTATASEARFESAGVLALKGVGDVPAWRFTRLEPASHARFAFVGRSAEMDVLGQAFGRARDGNATLMLLVAPPGQGKSRLADEAIRAFGAHRVIEAPCRPGAETGTKAPLRQLLETDVPGAAPDAVRARLAQVLGGDEGARTAAAVCHSAGVEADERILALPRLEQRDVIANAWRRYLAAIAHPDLLVVFIEDVHWGDLVLHRVLERLTSDLTAPLLVLTTGRPELLGSPLMRPRPDALQLELAPLDTEAASQLAELAGGAGRPVERAGGNPLFIIELAQASAEAQDMPLTVQAAISARLDELSPFDRELLQCASVVGERFEARDAALLADEDAGEVAGSLARAAHFGCIVPLAGASFRFHHILVREVAYGRLPVAERMSLHARYARDGIPPDDAEARAHHWWEAVNPVDAEWVWTDRAALRAMRREAYESQMAAARRLEERNAYEEALLVYERALTLADDPLAVAHAEAGLGAAYARSSKGDEAWSHRLRAIELLNQGAGSAPARLYADTLEIATGMWGYFQQLPEHGEVLRLLDEGARAARAEGDTVSHMRLVVGRAAFTNSLPSDEQTATILAAHEPRFADPAQRMAHLYLWNGEIERATELYRWVFDELLPAGAVINDREALIWYALAEVYAGDLDHAQVLAERLLDEARDRSAHTRQHALGTKALVQLSKGDWLGVTETSADLRDLVRDNPDASFCLIGAAVAGHEVIAAILGSGAVPNDLDEYVARLVPTNPLIRASSTMVAKVLAGDADALAEGLKAYAAELPLWDRARVWDVADVMPAMALTLLRRWDDLAPTLQRLDHCAERGSRLAAAVAEAVREEHRAADDGPTPGHASLRALGYHGLSAILATRREQDAGRRRA